MTRVSMSTITGHFFDLANPADSRIDIVQIALALSKLCRYTGHTRSHYSVAQHSVIVSHAVPPHLAMQGLLHDAAEAFTGDISAPVKRLVPEFKALERRIEESIFPRLGIPVDLAPEVKEADILVRRTELRDLLTWPVVDEHDDWRDVRTGPVLSYRIAALPDDKAAQLFMDRYYQLLADLPPGTFGGGA